MPSPSPAAAMTPRWLDHTKKQQQAQRNSKVELRRIYGHTCHISTSVYAHPTHSNEFLHTCGSTLVLSDYRTQQQKSFFLGRRGHALAACTISEDAAWCAAGEYAPTHSSYNAANAASSSTSVLIWNLATGDRLSTLSGHIGTIRLLKFSPLKDYLLVISDEGATDATALTNPATNTKSSSTSTPSIPLASHITLWRVSDKCVIWSRTFKENDFPSTSTPPNEPRLPLITSLDWSCDNTYFVICGARYLHYYYLRTSSTPDSVSTCVPVPISSSSSSSASSYLTLEKQEAKLGQQHESEVLISIACGSGTLASYTYGLSSKGVLCAFTLKDRRKKVTESSETPSSVASSINSSSSSSSALLQTHRWEIEKWVDLRLPHATSLSLAKGLIPMPSSGGGGGEVKMRMVLAMSGADSKIRVFEASKLEHIATLPKPAPFPHDRTKYPHTLLSILSSDAKRVISIYSDRSLVVWDSSDIKKKPIWTNQAHSDGIWDLSMISNGSRNKQKQLLTDADYNSDEDEKSDTNKKYPSNSFFTCSNDNTVRVWNADSTNTQQTASIGTSDQQQLWLGADCLSCIYVPPHDTGSKIPIPTGLRCIKFIPSDAVSKIVQMNGSGSTPNLSSFTNGLLALGDSYGNIRLYNLTDLKLVHTMEAHDKEVRCLEFHQTSRSSDNSKIQPFHLPLLMSGSRDHMVHVHNLNTPSMPQSYTPQEVHTSTVTQVRVTTLPASTTGGVSEEEQLLLISGGLDKQLSIRRLRVEAGATLSSLSSLTLDVTSDSNKPSLTFPTNQIVDLCVHPTRKFLAVLCNNTEKRAATSKASATASTNKPVNCIVKMIDLYSCRESRQYNLQTLSNGEPVRMALDPSGLLLAIAFSDKSILLLDWYSGSILTTFYTHSQLITSLSFTNDCTSLISAGLDGVIAVWKLEDAYVKAMKGRLKEMREANNTTSTATTNGSAKAVDAKKVVPKAATASPAKPKRSTAMDYLDDDDDEDEEDGGEEDSKRAEDQPAKSSITEVPAIPASAPPLSTPPGSSGGNPLPLLVSSPDISLVSRTSAVNRQILPSWARSTVVSPDGTTSMPRPSLIGMAAASDASASAGGASRPGTSSAHDSGAVSSTPSAPRGRWAQRVEVDAQGVPLVHVRSDNKVYDPSGTIGVGTVMLDETDIDASPTASSPNEEVDIELEGDSDNTSLEVEDIEDEESPESLSQDDYTNGQRDLTVEEENQSMMRSSITAQFFAKLKEEGKLPVIPSTPQQKPATTSAPLPNTHTTLPVLPASSHAKSIGISMPSSYLERENKTTNDLQQVRQQMKSLGIYDSENGGGAEQPNATPVAPLTTAKSSTPLEPLLSISPNTSVVIASNNSNKTSKNTSTNSSQVEPSGANVHAPTLLPPLSSVHASMSSLPASMQSLALHRSTLESFQTSLKNLLEMFGQVKQAQANVNDPAAATGVTPSVSVSFAQPSSSSNVASTVVVPIITDTSSLRNSSIVTSSQRPSAASLTSLRSSSVSFPSISQSPLSTTADASQTDLATLASVYEEQLATAKQVLMQMIPDTAGPSTATSTSSSIQPLSISHLTPVVESTSSSAAPTARYVGGAAAASAVDPLALSQTHAQFLASLESGMDQHYDRMSERLADLVLKRIEAKVAMGGTGMLSTTQQLALGMTLSQPSSAEPSMPPAFSSARSESKEDGKASH